MKCECQRVEGELFRFHVQSRSRKDFAHFVDLQENEFNGKCSCEHFACRLQPLLNEGEEPSDDTICEHIRACREEWFHQMAPALAAIAEGKTVRPLTESKSKNEQSKQPFQHW